MKHVIAYLLVLAILLHLFAELIVLVSFEINQDYIAEFLCINKDEPESSCNGCCHLKKELDEQQENKESQPQSENKKIEIQYFENSSDKLNDFTNNETASIVFFLNNNGITTPNTIFHPPQSIHA